MRWHQDIPTQPGECQGEEAKKLQILTTGSPDWPKNIERAASLFIFLANPANPGIYINSSNLLKK
jgi:hypothetical protein